MKSQFYSTVVADPPWPYHSQDLKASPLHRPNTWDGPTGGVAAQQRYSLMSVAAMKELPISRMVAINAHLYLWTTNSFLVEAHDLALAWGFKPKTLVTWVKHKAGEPTIPSMKMGYWFRSASEHCLFAVRGRLRLKNKVCIPTWFAHPRLRHSGKPALFRQIVETASPGPYLELFARENYSGWDAWGNEVPKSIDLTGS